METVEIRYWMGSIYISLIVLWLIIISLFQFTRLGLIGILICSIPFFAFIISMYFSDQVEHTDEASDTVAAGFLTFCLLIVAILSNWKTKNVKEKTVFFQIIVIGVILVMFSMVEIWVPTRYNPVLKYYRSGLRTLAFTMFILALYKYYQVNALVALNNSFNE